MGHPDPEDLDLFTFNNAELYITEPGDNTHFDQFEFEVFSTENETWDLFILLRMFQDRNSDGTDGDHTGFGEDDLFYPRKTDRASSYDQGSHTLTLLML